MTEASAPVAPPVKVMDPAEFREIGFLQEVNRMFLHPRGLALEIVTEDCTVCGGEEAASGPSSCEHCGGRGFTATLGRIWDYREDPEGIVFGGEPGSMLSPAKAEAVEQAFQRHLPAREALLGRAVQAIGGEIAPEVTDKREEKPQ